MPFPASHSSSSSHPSRLARGSARALEWTTKCVFGKSHGYLEHRLRLSSGLDCPTGSVLRCLGRYSPSCTNCRAQRRGIAYPARIRFGRQRPPNTSRARKCVFNIISDKPFQSLRLFSVSGRSQSDFPRTGQLWRAWNDREYLLRSSLTTTRLSLLGWQGACSGLGLFSCEGARASLGVWC